VVEGLVDLGDRGERLRLDRFELGRLGRLGWGVPLRSTLGVQPWRPMVQPTRLPPVGPTEDGHDRGSSSIRTIVASMRIAAAMPMPITFRIRSGFGMNAA